MARGERPRYIPPRIGKRDFDRVATIPRWFLREAVQAFGLTPYDFATFCTIADNLDPNGVSVTAIALIAERCGMSRNGAAKCIDTLIHHQLIFELDPRQKGRMMRYAIPPEIPWYNR